MDESKQPGIKIEEIILLKSSGERDPLIPKNTTLKTKANFEFNYTINNNKTAGSSSVGVQVRLIKEDDEKRVALFSARYLGRFSIEVDPPNIDLVQFLESNAPALLYSYLRQHIQSVSVKSGLPPIHLPIMNIVALIHDLKQKQAEQNNSEVGSKKT